VDSIALQQSLRHLDTAYSNFFKKIPPDKKAGTVVIKKMRVKKKKLHIETGEGWEIKRILLNYSDGIAVGEKKLKNNKRFTVPKSAHKWFKIETTLKNLETGTTVMRKIRTKGWY